MQYVPFFSSVRAKFLAASFVLLLIPIVGFLFVRELVGYLRAGQEQVAVAAVRLVAASLSDRPEIDLRTSTVLSQANVRDATIVERERIVALFSASDPETVSSLGENYLPDKQVERILNQSGMRDGRIWVIDAGGKVRGLVGALSATQTSVSTKPRSAEKGQEWLSRFAGLSPAALLAPFTRTVMPYILPAVNNVLANNDTKPLVMAQAQRAAVGEPTVQWRVLPDKVALLSVAAPIWQQEGIVAAVVIEETDLEYRNLAKGAAESVIVITLIVFLVVFGVLAGFAFRLTHRLSRLQREANRAIDAQGRVRGEIHATNDRDEIGALNKSLRAMVARQASYNSYLEQLAARLSHELRTPVAVVRSSLDNLRASSVPKEDLIFLARADEGVARLSKIISRMSEATQLERLLQGAQRESIDIVALVGGCVAGYQQTFLSHRFVFTSDVDALFVDAVADAIAQMLDKLVQNAIDFAHPESSIAIRVSEAAERVAISVENNGPLLPEGAGEIASLFESMVSKRVAESAEAHLGLGLYIARLVAEFHQGTIGAENLTSRAGVKFTVTVERSSVG